MDNQTVATFLSQYADYLEAREANLYRVRAYRRAAETVLMHDRPVAHVVETEGREGLEALPGIGRHLSYTIAALVKTGEFRTVDNEGGHVDTELIFASLPGVSRQLARRFRSELGIQTLEQLEQAALEGKLSELGIGSKRLRGIVDALAGRLRRQRSLEATRGEPPVAELLAIDQEYRERSEKSELPTLAPRRFNPEHEPWLPILETKRDGWSYRALYSNTPVAHRLRRTQDWVVVYFDDGVVSGQRTVVTESRGSLRGRRVVRGREVECRTFYEAAHHAGGSTAAAG